MSPHYVLLGRFWEKDVIASKSLWGLCQPLHVPPADATRMKGCKQALGVLWHGQQMGGRVLSPLDEKHKTLANQAPASPSPASKVSGATALCFLCQAGPELLPSLSSGSQATEELPAGTRGWHQGLHQAQDSHPVPPEGASCLRGGRRIGCVCWEGEFWC